MLVKHLARAAAVGVSAMGLLMAFGPAAGASSAAVTHHAPAWHQARALAAARSDLRKLLAGEHDTAQWYENDGPHAGVKAQTEEESTNWSGYADTGSGFSKVTAQWVEPGAACGFGQSLAAFWVGLDGFSSNSVEQDGTLIECDGGQAFYFTWWEMFPANAVQIVSDTLSPGDTVRASVTRSGTRYTLAVTDFSHPGSSFATTQTCSNCANSSAEWIAEAPSGSAGVEPLSRFGTWRAILAGATAGSASGAISSFTDDEIVMVDSEGRVEAQPSHLNANGNFFQVTWRRGN